MRAAAGLPKLRRPGMSRCVASWDGHGKRCAVGEGERPGTAEDPSNSCPRLRFQSRPGGAQIVKALLRTGGSL